MKEKQEVIYGDDMGLFVYYFGGTWFSNFSKVTVDVFLIKDRWINILWIS